VSDQNMPFNDDDWRNETAAALFRSPDLELVWSNKAYRDFLSEPHRTNGAEGLLLPEFSPIGSAVKTEAMRRCMMTGTPECGHYSVFSVEEGTTLRRWRVYRPIDDHLLLLVDTDEPQTGAGDIGKRWV